MQSLADASVINEICLTKLVIVQELGKVITVQ